MRFSKFAKRCLQNPFPSNLSCSLPACEQSDLQYGDTLYDGLIAVLEDVDTVKPVLCTNREVYASNQGQGAYILTTVSLEIRHIQQMKKLLWRHHEQRVTIKLVTVICCVCRCLAWYEFAARHSNQHTARKHSRQDWQLLLCSAQGH